MIEALDLLAEDEVLQQSRTALSNTQTVLILDRTAHIGGHIGVIVAEVVLRQELLRGCSGVVGRRGIAGIELAGHVRTSCMSQTDDTGNEREGAHCFGNPGLKGC